MADMADTDAMEESLLEYCVTTCTEISCFASCMNIDIGSRHQNAGMVDERVRTSVIISCFATFCSILGALLVIYISQPSIFVSRPWLCGVLKSFLAGALGMAMIADASDTEADVQGSWASILGGSLCAGIAEDIIYSSRGAVDATLTEEEAHELQKREFDSSRVRERALRGGILTAIVIGLRNLAFGVWFFSLVNSWRWMLDFPVFLAPQFVTLGAAVAVPMTFATKCIRRTLLAVAVSSAAFPWGYIVASFALPSAAVVLKLLEFTQGMMLAFVIMYMFPSSMENAPRRHFFPAFFVAFAGMAGIRFGIFGKQ